MNIQEIRKQKHFTQEELAKESGLSLRTIQRIEAGQMPKGHTARVLAKALNVDINSLIIDNKDDQGEMNLFLVKIINLSSLFVTFVPLLNIILPLVIMHFSKQVNSVTKQIISLQIFWTIASFAIFLISALLKNALNYSNQFTLWVMVSLLFTNVVIILMNTASIDRKKKLHIKLKFSFL